MRRLRNYPACRSQGLTSVTIVPLESIQYDDYPEIRVNEHERTEMPFRYVKDADSQPIMPPVCFIHLYGVHILTIVHRAWLISSRRMPTKAWMIFSKMLDRVHTYWLCRHTAQLPRSQAGPLQPRVLSASPLTLQSHSVNSALNSQVKHDWTPKRAMIDEYMIGRIDTVFPMLKPTKHC